MIALTGLGLALFNTPNHAAIIASVPEKERGLAAGMIQTMFGLAHLSGVAVGSALLNVLYGHYTGMADARPSALDHPAAFVSSSSRMFQLCVAFGLIAVVCSFLRGGSQLSIAGSNPLREPTERVRV
jgi:fucose permease